MRKYRISVVCSDATTITAIHATTTRKIADSFCLGICYTLESQGKGVFLSRVELIKGE